MVFVSGWSKLANQLRDCDPGHADHSAGVSHVASKPSSYASKTRNRSRMASELGCSPDVSRASIAQIDSVATAGKDVSSQPMLKQTALTLCSSPGESPAQGRPAFRSQGSPAGLPFEFYPITPLRTFRQLPVGARGDWEPQQT